MNPNYACPWCLTRDSEHELDCPGEIIDKLRAENARLREALRDARKNLIDACENMGDWGTYASEYFREKHNLQGDLTAITEAVQAIDKALEEAQP